MGKKHTNILYPQWQGGGLNKATFEGAMEVKKNYLNMDDFTEVEVSLNEDEKIENKIWAYSSIVQQIHRIKALLDIEKPDTIFTVGGGDDIEIIPMSYMNHKMNGDMTVAFFDAHGDLNTPESSPSKNFHGMPLRTLFGESDTAILDLLYSELDHSQIVMIGTRDCDPAEEYYIKEHEICVVASELANGESGNVIDALKSKNSKNVYVHIDVDVIDPTEFPYQPVPAEGGLTIKAFSKVLKDIANEFNIVGVCVLGYTSLNGQNVDILNEIIHLGTNI
jgi:arginase